MPPNVTVENFRTTLKSSSLIGGASFINILVGMVRTKFVAILLGPSGVGLFGMYGQLTVLVGSVASMGIGNSGVRQVAEAVGTGDDERVSRTVITLRRAAWLTGALGMLVMAVFCVPLSSITFGNSDYAWSLAILGVTLLFSAISGGQGCIINGTRRIGDLAKISVIGAISSTLVSIPCFYLWGQKGIVPSLILSSLAGLATSWWFARRVPLIVLDLPWRDSTDEARRLLSLGISFMGGGLVLNLSTYLIRIVLLRQFGLADLGNYQAAFNLSGILVGFVLGAMGADYYPRLTAVAAENAIVHRMVNEQTQISILLSLPGLAAMMIFAPLVIHLFYAPSFATAVPILRWCILGSLGQVMTWPMGIVILAKGNGRLFFIFEVVTSGLHLFFVFIYCRLIGIDGSGIAFMSLYVISPLLLLVIMRKLVGAAWTKSTLILTLIATVVMVLLLLNCTLNNNRFGMWSINMTVLAVVVIMCIRQLFQRSGIGINNLLDRIGIRKRY
jgi:PST family polysaccharide transporter